MRLGGSLARRRGGGRGRRPRGAKPGPKKPAGGAGGRRWRFWLAALGVVALGWAAGYVVATQVLFPAPPPPGDLFEVPDLRGLGLASARERLAGLGLEVGEVDSLPHPTVPRSLIVGQAPLPGQLARAGTPVDVTLSTGPQLRPVPDIDGLDETAGRILLESSGFRVVVDTAQSDEVPRGHVIETVPPADTVLPLPAEVTMVVSTGAPSVTMPLVLGLEEAEARRVLDSLGLVVAEVREVFRFGRDQGIVVEQQPAADTELRRGDPVRLAVGRRRNLREQ